MEVTDQSFAAEVLQRREPVLVDFWASWCPPCKMMEPILSRLADEYAGRARVVQVNIDRNPVAAEQYRIHGVPTFVVFHRGQQKGRLTAAQTAGKLRRMLDEALAEGQE